MLVKFLQMHLWHAYMTFTHCISISSPSIYLTKKLNTHYYLYHCCLNCVFVPLLNKKCYFQTKIKNKLLTALKHDQDSLEICLQNFIPHVFKNILLKFKYKRSCTQKESSRGRVISIFVSNA